MTRDKRTVVLLGPDHLNGYNGAAGSKLLSTEGGCVEDQWGF